MPVICSISLNNLNALQTTIKTFLGKSKAPQSIDIYNEMTDNFSKVFSDGSEDDFDNIFTLNLEANVSEYKANAVLSDETISRYRCNKGRGMCFPVCGMMLIK